MANLRIELRAARADHKAQRPGAPEAAAVVASLRNAGDASIVLDLHRASIPALALEVKGPDERGVLLAPPPVPDERASERTRIELVAGAEREVAFAAFLDGSLPSGEYRVRYRLPSGSVKGEPSGNAHSDWVVVRHTRSWTPNPETPARPRPEPPRPRPPLPIPGWLRKLIQRLCRRRCDRADSREIDREISETISGAPAGYEAWNGTYAWHARFLFALEQRACRATATVRVRINGSATDAQKDAWKAAILAKWHEQFKACCTESCCARCCPNGYRLAVDLQFVSSGEHHVVTVSPTTTNMTSWSAADTVDVTHEFGHMLGNKEEYFVIDGVSWGPGRQPTGSIMNNPANQPAAHHFELLRAELEASLGNAACVVKPSSEPC
jgi:hypothetical protein